MTGGGGSLTLATLPSTSPTGYPMDTFTVPEGEDPSFYLPIPHGPLGIAWFGYGGGAVDVCRIEYGGQVVAHRGGAGVTNVPVTVHVLWVHSDLPAPEDLWVD